MNTIWLIVKAQENSIDEVLEILFKIPDIKLERIKDNQIIASIVDADDIHVVAQKTKEIAEMKGVMAVYPVFSPESLPF